MGIRSLAPAPQTRYKPSAAITKATRNKANAKKARQGLMSLPTTRVGKRQNGVFQAQIHAIGQRARKTIQWLQPHRIQSFLCLLVSLAYHASMLSLRSYLSTTHACPALAGAYAMNRRGPQVMRLHAADNVVIVLNGIAAGARPDGLPVAALDAAGPGHKIATTEITSGGLILRYGQTIGVATRDIAAGEHGGGHGADHDFGCNCQPLSAAPPPRVFQGFRRADGKAETRNYSLTT